MQQGITTDYKQVVWEFPVMHCIITFVTLPQVQPFWFFHTHNSSQWGFHFSVLRDYWREGLEILSFRLNNHGQGDGMGLGDGRGMANIHKHYPPSPQIPHVWLMKKCIGIHYVLAECRIWKMCSLAYWMYEVHKSTDDNGGGGGGGGMGDNGGDEKKKDDDEKENDHDNDGYSWWGWQWWWWWWNNNNNNNNNNNVHLSYAHQCPDDRRWQQVPAPVSSKIFSTCANTSSGPPSADTWSTEKITGVNNEPINLHWSLNQSELYSAGICARKTRHENITNKNSLGKNVWC